MSLPFFPPSLSTCVLWLDASDPTCISVSSGRIISWLDKSQFSNNTTVVSPQAPLLSNINNLSSIFFQGNAGTAQYFQGPLSSFSSIYAPSTPVLSLYLTMFAVGTLSTTSVFGFFPNFIGAGFRSNYYPGTQLVQWSTTEANISVFPHATSNSNYATLPSFNQQFIVTNSAFYNATTSFSYLNVNGYPVTRSDGTNVISPSVISSLGVYSIGGSLSTSTDFRNSWTGHIAEVIMYTTSSILTWNQRQLVEGYLASKWGVQNSLPPYHPYKNTAISISTPTSAVYISNSNTNRTIIFPSTNTVSTQLLWTMPKYQGASMSSVAYVPNYKEFFDSNGSLILNQNTQSALLVNNPTGSNWLVHSLATNNLFYTAQNVTLTPYIQYPKATKADTVRQTLGQSVAISSNGNYIVAGAPGFDTPLTNAGALFMFIQNPSTGLYSTFQTFISPSTTQSGGSFGQKVAMSEDATYIAGSSSNLNFTSPTFSGVGYVSIFKKSATTDFWSFTQQLNPPTSDYRTPLRFGKSLVMSSNGDYIFVGANNNVSGITGAGAVYPFKKAAGTDFWTQLPTIYPPATVYSFGDTISITPDAGFLLIGTSNYTANVSGLGTLFFYTKDTLTDSWNFKQEIRPSDNSLADFFTYSIALARNSNYFVATTREGNNYVYKKSTTTDYWNFSYILYYYTKIPITFFGQSCAISENADYILISGEGDSTARNLGGCILYQKQSGTDLWETTNYFYSSDGDFFTNFGRSVSMTPTAATFVVGSPASASVTDGIVAFKQSSIGVATASNTFLLVNTSNPTKTILLPHPSTNNGQMLFIKDANQQALYSPIRISTINNSFINSTFSNFTFFENNACIQLQSDGMNQYNIVNYFNGIGGAQPSMYNFQSFWIKGSIAGPQSNYTVPIVFRQNPNVNVNNYFFLDSDNTTPLSFWNETVGNSGINVSNIFWVKIPYIPPSPMTKQFFLYWNCNSLYFGNPSNVFPFFDDFTGPTFSDPNSNNWFVTKQGSVDAQVFLNGLTDSITLTGVSNVSANGGILTKNTFLSTNFSLCFTSIQSASTFFTAAFATTSTLQFLTTGGQSNWWWTTLGNGYTLTLLTNAIFSGFTQAENAAPLNLGSNAVGSWNFTTAYNFEFTYTSNGSVSFLCNSANRTARTTIFTSTNTTYLNSNKYIFFGQGSISTAPARSTILCNVFIRNYVNPEPSFVEFGGLNIL